MVQWLEPYQWSILWLGVVGAMSLLQLLAFDFMAIKHKHPPGHPIEPSHSNLLFRLSRAHANTNETMAAMITLFLFTLLTAADPVWVNRLMGAYLAARLGHMVCYYAGWAVVRGVVFGISLLALLGLFVLGLLSWL